MKRAGHPPTSILVGALALSIMGSGCVSVLRGTKEKLTVISVPPGAKITLSNGRTGKTPATFKLDRSQTIEVRIEMAGYEPMEVDVEPQMTGRGAIGLAGNMMFGLAGLAGAAVDATSGASCSFVPNPVYVELVPIRGNEVAPAGVPPDEVMRPQSIPAFTEGEAHIQLLGEEVKLSLVDAPGSDSLQIVSYKDAPLDPASYVQWGRQRRGVEISGDSFAVGGPVTFRMVDIDPLGYAKSQGAPAPRSGSVVWVEPGEDLQTVVVTTDPTVVESYAEAVMVSAGQAIPKLKLELYLSVIENGYTLQFLFGEGTEYWGATTGPVRLNGEVYRNLRGARVVNGRLSYNPADVTVGAVAHSDAGLNSSEASAPTQPQGKGSGQAVESGGIALPLDTITNVEPFDLPVGSPELPGHKTVTLNFKGWATDVRKPSIFNQYMLFSGDGEIYVSYPSVETGIDETKPLLLHGVHPRYSLSPTTSAAWGIATGTVCYCFKPSAADQRIMTNALIDLNFGPGAEISFTDPSYKYPVGRGYVAVGKGIRIVSPSPENPTGIVPIDGTILERITGEH